MKKWYISSVLGLFILLCQVSNVKAQSWKELMDSCKFYIEKQDFQNALYCSKLALPQAEIEFGKNDSNYVSTLGSVSRVFYYLGILDSAVYYGEMRLTVSRKLYKWTNSELAKGINNLAVMYIAKGDNKHAEPLLKEALEMKRQLYKEDHPDLAKSINNMAAYYDAIADYKQAEPLFKEALDMRRRLFKIDHSDLAISINNMANFYNDRGDYKKAEPLYIEALDMRRRMLKSDNPDLAFSINNMAYFYYNKGDFKQAEPLFKEALAMIRRLHKEDHSELAGSINNMANYYDITGDNKQAEPLFVEALEMYRRLYKDDHPDLATGINNMAGFYQDRENYMQAENLYKEALEMRRRLYNGNHPDLAMSLYNMADFYNEIGDFKQSENFYKEALNVYKSMLDNYLPSLSESERNLFWNTVKNEYEAFNSFGVKRFLENPLIACNMYDMQLYTKALLFNSTNKIKKRVMNSNDLALIDKYNEFIEKKELLVKLYTLTEDSRIKNGFNTDSIEKITNDLEKEISLKSELYPQGYDKQKVTWKSIQTLLKPDEASVEVVRFRYKEKNRFTDTIYYAFLIVTDQMEDHPDIVVLENGKDLENDYYTNYRIKIKGKTEDNLSYGRYWEKLHDKLKGIKKVYFSADGIYNKLNPATLLMPNGKYLLEEQDIQQVNSTKDIIIGYQKSKEESNIYNSAVLIGNPNFSLSESKVREATKKMKVQNYDDNNFEKLASIGGIELTKLPGTEKEIKDIEKFLKGKNWKVNCYLANRALKTAIKSVSSPRILHIATHGMFLEDVNIENKETFGFETKKVVDNPLLRSGLFFTGADNYLKSDSDKPTGEDNGLLTAYEAMNLDLDKTELVVLSACETGLGEVKNGEGVFGLRRAFQQAGAKAVIMSLWSVDDEATQKLMSSFYSNWITGITKRDAFNKAQQEVRSEFKEPYFWGAFVMVGE
ncbi:MAG: CHAT domain-containing tetratricopeptide repeat protein [bacterium]